MMELISLTNQPIITHKAIPFERTKTIKLSIDKTKHCRVCSTIAQEAVEHDENRLHSSTVVSA